MGALSAGVEPAGAASELAGVDFSVVDTVGAEAEPDLMAEASCAAPAVPPACAEAAFSEDVVAWLTLAGRAEEAPEQLKSKRGVVLRVVPTIPKLGFGVVGYASWRVYHHVLIFPKSLSQPT